MSISVDWRVTSPSGVGSRSTLRNFVSKCVGGGVTDDARCDDDASGWARTLAGTIASADAAQARVIGVASDRDAAGVTQIAQQLVVACQSFGRSAYLIDAASDSESVAQDMRDVDAGCSPDQHVKELGATYRKRIDGALLQHDLVIVELPPVVIAGDRPAPAFIAGGQHCDLTYLVCVTGEVTRAELKRCLENFKISRVKLGGLILNDCRLPFSRLLGEG